MPRFRLTLRLGLLLLVVAAGCGGDEGDEGQQGGPAGAKAQVQAPELKVLRPDARSTTRESRVKVEGTVTTGASVEVAGRRAEIEGPANEEGFDRWSAEVPVDRGRNVIEITAESEGETATEEIVVVRRAARRSSDGEGSDSPETADADPGAGDQGGPAGDSGGDQGGAGGSGGDQGGAGGSGGDQGGPQGGSGGATDGNQGGGTGGPPDPDGNQGGPPGAEGGQGGPPAAPPPP